MFALSFTLLFLSLVSALLGFSGAVGSMSFLACALAFVLLGFSMLALTIKWKPRSTCFIYPTFACDLH